MSSGKKGYIIAIDGPVASGKGTIAPRLAEKLHGFYMNTGALFRSLGLLCKRHHLAVTETNLLSLIKSNTLDLDGKAVLVNNKDVSSQIYSTEMSHYASQIAVIPSVHEQVIKIEQEIGERNMKEGKIVIVEGRNIGTAVFPDATIKLFLTAKVEERAQRRFQQALARNEEITYDQVLIDTKERDDRDQSRGFYPLVSEPEKHGYLVIDNTGFTEEQTLSYIIDEIRKMNLL